MSIRNPPWVSPGAYFACPDPMAAASGANITALNASNFASGTLATARMSANVLTSAGGLTAVRVIATQGGAFQNVTIVGGQITSWTVT